MIWFRKKRTNGYHESSEVVKRVQRDADCREQRHTESIQNLEREQNECAHDLKETCEILHKHGILVQ